MAINPFEPPRSPALEAPGGLAVEGQALPDEALRELRATAGPATWAARLAIVSLVVTILNSVVTLSRSAGPSQVGGVLGGLVVAVPMTLFFAGLYRRYAGHARRLTPGDPAALSGTIDVQRSIFKTFGVLMILSMSLAFTAMLIGLLGYLASRR